jgi:hypothetical protein
VVGSDLQPGATESLKEIAQAAYSANNVDVLVAFGGSKIPGWQGMKIADENCLYQDAQDGIFGNDNCYIYADENTNMADESSFEKFLNEVKNRYENYDIKVLDIWDHGGAYQGIGLDSNHEPDLLELTELKQAFENSGTKFDIIGFDACLMGNAAVLKAIAPYAKYAIASPEPQPVLPKECGNGNLLLTEYLRVQKQNQKT